VYRFARVLASADVVEVQVILGGNDPAVLVPLEEVERRYIPHALDALGGNLTLAARALGLDRKTLYRKLRQYGVLSGDSE
jgi:transcriptional regulator of acetoin/glycerol metabolism